jgi:hypothetical protein
MKNIHLIPTDKPSRVYKHLGRELKYTVRYFEQKGLLCINQHIYITNDEEIKLGDWVIEFQKGDSIGEVHFINSEYVIANDIQKKIILTTDPSLAPDVQKINDEFLEWFVKNPSCEEVKIEKLDTFKKTNEVYIDEITKGNYCEIIKQYQIIIPKEEQKQHIIDIMKSDEELGLYEQTKCYCGHTTTCDCGPEQEILLEDIFNDDKKENIKKFIDEINNPSQPNDKLKQAFEKYSEYLEDFENKDTYEHGFKDGAKCQQEISYSEEEVLQLVSDWTDYRMSEDIKSKVTFKKWFEQFKKK